ncbi:hypothetical protein Dsin_009692 [Dipteronia sinensis]|uniref:RRM domain-containing protein n=1 Tax=Dipteronia sinensis TaxID=43782 RepID=A0AAE0ECB8_9ROSI|nr:hypothetical protein Dsin_009692 [Dipteronia sinensis]
MCGVYGTVFRVFGRVRDVFLSSRVSGRRSNFAFIRFHTMEEARKVAQSTHGMHIYGREIVSKVASHGWEMRRSVDRQRSRGSPIQKRTNERDSRPNGDYNFASGKKSYAGAVGGVRPYKDRGDGSENSKMISISVEGLQPDEDWLKRRAVGALKVFANISDVNQNLVRRGIPFSTAYSGDKSIIWSFQSEKHRDYFIKNQLLWKIGFSSMVKSGDSVIPQARMAWISCSGVPLTWWIKPFFMRLGWIIGEPLLVDDNTKYRNRCDRGRFLALIPHNQSCPSKIRVIDGRRSFSVTLSEEATLCDEQWIRSFLGLKKKEEVLSELKSGNTISMVVREATRNNGDRLDRGNEVGGTDNEMTGVKKAEPKVNFSGFPKVLGRHATLDKGKQVAMRKTRFKLTPRTDPHAKIDLEKRCHQGQQYRLLTSC